MSEKLIEVVDQLELELSQLKVNNLSFNHEITEKIKIIESYLFQVQDILQVHFFSSVKSEIDFFKKIYPKLFRLYYYYKTLHVLEEEKINQCIHKDEEQELYINYLNEIKFYHKQESKIFREIRYYSTISEKKLYLRKHYRFRRTHLIQSINDTYITNAISTAIGKREAYADVILYIESCIKAENLNKLEYDSGLNWTDKKAFLVELIYAIYLKESINNGKVELIRLIRFFENHFNVILNNHHSIIQELKKRKTGKTKYFDQIKALLMKKLNE